MRRYILLFFIIICSCRKTPTQDMISGLEVTSQEISSSLSSSKLELVNVKIELDKENPNISLLKSQISKLELNIQSAELNLKVLDTQINNLNLVYNLELKNYKNTIFYYQTVLFFIVAISVSIIFVKNKAKIFNIFGGVFKKWMKIL